MLGKEQQHRSTVHVADLADAFRRVLEDDSARGHPTQPSLVDEFRHGSYRR